MDGSGQPFPMVSEFLLAVVPDKAREHVSLLAVERLEAVVGADLDLNIV